jgi:hypothetical protein
LRGDGVEGGWGSLGVGNVMGAWRFHILMAVMHLESGRGMWSYVCGYELCEYQNIQLRIRCGKPLYWMLKYGR